MKAQPNIRTEVITLDLGMAGEIEVDAICRWEPGQVAGREYGRIMEEEYSAYWSLIMLEHPDKALQSALNTLYWRRENFAYLVDELVAEATSE